MLALKVTAFGSSFGQIIVNTFGYITLAEIAPGDTHTEQILALNMWLNQVAEQYVAAHVSSYQPALATARIYEIGVGPSTLGETTVGLEDFAGSLDGPSAGMVPSLIMGASLSAIGGAPWPAANTPKRGYIALSPISESDISAGNLFDPIAGNDGIYESLRAAALVTLADPIPTATQWTPARFQADAAGVPLGASQVIVWNYRPAISTRRSRKPTF